MVRSGVSAVVKFMSMLPSRASTSPVGIVVTVGYQRRLLIVGPELQVLEAGSKISVVARPEPLVGMGSSPPPATNRRPSPRKDSPAQKRSSLITSFWTALVSVEPLGIVTT